jgi:hypothetical protein
MPRSKPQVNIDLVLPEEGGDTASSGWVRATEILLRVKKKRDNRDMDISSQEIASFEAFMQSNDSI